MTTQTETHSQIAVEVAGLKVNALQDGSGPNIVVFHHSTGSPGWIPFYDLLAENYTVTAVDMPGYGQSERPVWARHPRDIAMLLHSAVHKMGIDNDAHMVGMGFGGWVAAELAAMHLHGLDSLILVGAAGVQPEEGEIADVIFYEFEEYVKLGFSSDEAYAEVFGDEAAPELKELWDFSREMTARLTWKPWMFNRQLPHLISEVETPTLLLWGENDRVTPIGVAEVYDDSLPNSTLQVVDGAGHLVELENPQAAADAIHSFISGL